MRTLNYCCQQSATRITRSSRLVFTKSPTEGNTDTCPSTRNIPDCTDCVRHSQALLILLLRT
ncbi:hypothetical protein J6590_038147 [Homalodisca vitripennis]|nr:hypothetical protein J6590_038147 [Homalodisca vitripennis]